MIAIWLFIHSEKVGEYMLSDKERANYENIVRALYLGVLGREPDKVGFEHFMELLCDRAADIADVAAMFFNCAEHRAALSAAKGLFVGRWIDQRALDVETTAAARDLERMLDGIAEKWRAFGENEPHWSVLVSEDFLQKNLGTNVEKFYATGHPDVQRVLAALERSGVDLGSIGTALDYGCGVGRLSLALASHFDHVLGIDISAAHVRVAQEQAAKTGAGNVEFRTISSIGEIKDLPKADLVVSIIVLQHNPPPVMAEIFRNILKLLNPSGIAFVQMPTFIEGYSFRVSEYLEGGKVDMEMNCLPQRDIFRILWEENCLPLEVREDGSIGDFPGLSHTFLIQKQAE